MFSSRKLERATYDAVAFRFLAANDHPDHHSIAAFRKYSLCGCWPQSMQIGMLDVRLNARIRITVSVSAAISEG